MRKLWGATAIIVGTTIGAGILGLPRAVEDAGYFLGAFILLMIGVLMLITNLALGEVALRIKGNHQLPGLAEKLLGKKGKDIVSIAMMLSIYGAMSAYLIGISAILKEFFGGNQYIYALIVWVFIFIIVSRGIKIVSEVELGLGLGMLTIITLISLFALPHVSIRNYSLYELKGIFWAYGVALFAYMGFVAVPEAREVLIGEEKKLKKSIIYAGIISIVAYFLFSSAVIGVTGNNTTEVATIGLGNVLGKGFLIFGNLFALVAMLTSFIALSTAGLEAYYYDYKINKVVSLFLSLLPPWIVFILMQGSGFEKVIGVTGALTGAILGISIMHMYYKSKIRGNRAPEYKINLSRWMMILIDILFISGAISIALI